MLIYNKERFISTEVNMMIIRSKDNEGYYYVHRQLYDQAVVLNYLYKNDYKQLCEVITGKYESRDDVDMFYETLPTPINMLAPFLLLITDPLDELVDMVGAIHVMSGPINFTKMIEVPAAMRNEVQFSLSIKEEYQVAWDRFIMEAIPFTTDFYTAKSARPMNGTATVLEDENGILHSNGDEDEEEEFQEGVVNQDALLALLMDDEDPFAVTDEDLEEEEAEEEQVEEEPAPETPTVTQIVSHVEPEVQEIEVEEQLDEKKKSGLGWLRSLAGK